MKLTLDTIAHCSLSDLLAAPLACQCGRTHEIQMKQVVVEPGAIQKTARVLRELGYRKALIISDAVTWGIAGKRAADVLEADGFPYAACLLEGRVVPDEKTVGHIVIHAERDADVIVTVGAGVLNDLGKFVGDKLGVDNIVVATAPSVDGFASRHAALVVGSLKTSFAAACPRAIIGDVDILKQAPMSMIIGGWNDIMGKYTALSDWKIGRVVNDEYFCDVIDQMVRKSVQTCKANIERIKKRDPEAIQWVMEGLILTGIAMSFIGNSRPASGSEHHLSHCWEMRALEKDEAIAPHGAQVGVAATIIAGLCKKLAAAKVDFNKALDGAASFDETAWRARVEAYFGRSAPGVIAQIDPRGRYGAESRLRRLEKLQAHWPELQTILDDMPSPHQLRALLADAGAPVNPRDIGVTVEDAVDSVRMAKEARPKYTILGVLDDLGLLEPFANDLREELV